VSTAAEPQPASASGERDLGGLRTLVALHGAFNVVFGVLLIVLPGRTLTLIAILAGISPCFVGLFDLARALPHGLTGRERAGHAAVGLLALAAGVIVIARPDGSLKVVAVVAGIYLVVSGIVRMVAGEHDAPRSASLFHGAVALVAGVALLVWPDVTVGTLAAIYGAFLLILGVGELIFAFLHRRDE
jgi:uncharacterized membrane protein HdeD (DUF308 family)